MQINTNKTVLGMISPSTSIFLAVDPANSSSTVFLGQKIKINVRRTSRKNIPTTAFFKGPEVLDKATHPIMPKVQNINTSNTPSPIPATKVIFYINQNSKRSSVYDRVAKLNLAAILDFEDAWCRVLKMSWTNFGLPQCYICGTLSTQAKPNPSWILKTNWLLKNQGGGGFKSRRS